MYTCILNSKGFCLENFHVADDGYRQHSHCDICHVHHITMSTTASCHALIIKQLGSAKIRRRVNSRVKTHSGSKPVFFCGYGGF